MHRQAAFVGSIVQAHRCAMGIGDAADHLGPLEHRGDVADRDQVLHLQGRQRGADGVEAGLVPLEDLERLVGPGQHPEQPSLYASPLWVARQRAKTKGWDVVEGSCFAANPAGIELISDWIAALEPPGCVPKP